MSSYFLQTSRLGFRLWTEQDLDLALGLWGDPRVTELIDARGRLTKEQVREKLLKEISTEREHKIQYWPTFLLTTGKHVGCCGVRPYDPAKKIYELGVHILPKHWRNGFAAEACNGVMAYAFGTLGASALFAGHNPKNESSRQLLGKIGFRYTHDEFYPPTGLRHPSYLLTKEEYEGR